MAARDEERKVKKQNGNEIEFFHTSRICEGESYCKPSSVNRDLSSDTKPTSNQFDGEIAHNARRRMFVSLQCLFIVPTSVSHGSLPGQSDDSIFMEDDMLTCKSVESPDLEYPDNLASKVAGSLHPLYQNHFTDLEYLDNLGLFSGRFLASSLTTPFCSY